MFSQAGISAWQDVNAAAVRWMLIQSHKQGLSAKSIGLRLVALRQWFNYLVQQEQMMVNPALGIKSPKVGKHLPKILMRSKSGNYSMLKRANRLSYVIWR
ncbi:site-specific tyrosine recombinase XerC [Actinobacillus equuli]|nr:site-specific tyrosine recombinase XerC [Actinobacillus equuli]